MSSFLPQNDPNPRRRQAAIEKNQQTYVYNYTHVSPLAIVDRVPMCDEFSFEWIATVADRVVVALANRAELETSPEHRAHHLAKCSLMKKLIEVGESAVSDIKQLVKEAIRFELRTGARADRPQAMDDYAELFRTIGLPAVTRGCKNDKVFAWMRVAGPNPLIIRRIDALDERLAVTDEHFKVALPHDSLDRALAEGRLYLADYSVLDIPSTNDFPHGKKYVYAPLALFAFDSASRDLMPVAIQWPAAARSRESRSDTRRRVQTG